MVASFRSEAHNGDVNGNNFVVNKPAGTVDGDLLIAVGIATVGGVSPPAGWDTDAASGGNTGPLYTKIASGEPSSYTFDLGGTALGDIVIVCITGQASGSGWRDAVSGASGTGAIALPSVSPSGANRLLMQIVIKRSGTALTWSGPGSQTERFDVNAGQSQDRTAGGDEVVGSGATGTRTWTPSAGALTGLGYMLAIAPAPPKEGQFSGSYDFAGSDFVGQEGPGEGQFTGTYDFAGSDFVGVAGSPSSFGAFSGGYDFTGTFVGEGGSADFLIDIQATEGGRKRFGGRK